MRAAITLTLVGLFVFLAGFNVWNMLTSRGATVRGRRMWTTVHRAAGYAFIALFAILCFFMLQRVRGWSDELSPRLILHVSLALLLAPMLLAKWMVARYQKAERGLLTALGIAIFAGAFTLVALNVSIHFLRAATPGKLPAGTSATFLVAVLAAVTIPFFARRQQARPASDSKIRPLMELADEGRSGRGDGS